MNDPDSSFEDAWAGFQALDALQLVGGSSEWEWTKGRAQNLAFLVRIEDRAAREHLARMAERLAGIPGVEPLPDWFWHITVKIAGFQVIRRVHEDDVLQRDVPRITGKARALLSREEAFEAQLGLAGGFAWDHFFWACGLNAVCLVLGAMFFARMLELGRENGTLVRISS